jgi:hypothetical protein
MRQAALVCGAIFAILATSCAASAQTVAQTVTTTVASDPATPGPVPAETFVAQLGVPPAIPSFALASATPSPEPNAEPNAEPMPASQKDAPAAGSGADVPPQGVYGVFPSYRYQVYVGYAFLRFYVIPGTEENTNGLDFSVAYYFRDALAVDGEMTVTLGTYSAQNSEFFLGMGGVRYRHPVGRLDVWVHGLAGAAHFSPQTAFGSENGFGYEAGGGADYTPRHLRLSLRVQADMVGSHLYGTFQYSPKVSFGLVYKD